MKTIETNHGGDWRDQLLNRWPFALHTDAVATSCCVSIDTQGVYRPDNRSLFANGFVMVRLMLPFGIWLHMKPLPDRRLQLGIGWKLNGRFGALLRWQSDVSAAAGTHGPNVGQARGWDRGPA